jgi:hypothetical protein
MWTELMKLRIEDRAIGIPGTIEKSILDKEWIVEL